MRRGFSLIELLVVLAIIAVLSTIAIPSYNAYRKHAIKTVLMQDIRTCLSHVEAHRQTGSEVSLSRVVAQCPKGSETKSIELVSESPDIVLKAKAVDYDMECVYSIRTGRFSCQ